MFRQAYRALNRRLAVRRNVSVGADLQVGAGVVLTAPSSLAIGRHVRVGNYSIIACDGSIGDGVLIASHVGIVGRYDHDHRRIGVPISLAPWIYSAGARAPGDGDRVVIEDDVWIGFGAVILSGVRVGRGAIVAAGAVVVKSVEPYTIVAGNPASPIGRRFDAAEAEQHERLLAPRPQRHA